MVDRFFEGRDEVHKTLSRLVKRLERAKISYAIVGGLALTAHNYRRVTRDVDILVTSQDFARFQELFVPRHYERQEGRPRRFTDRANGVTLEILVTGLFPGTGKPGPIALPDPAKVVEVRDKKKVIKLATLVELKLAARRWRDFADVVELIRFNNMGGSFARNLHSSVRKDFIECLEEKRREDEYEARESEP
jgi:hypothetical protein